MMKYRNNQSPLINDSKSRTALLSVSLNTLKSARSVIMTTTSPLNIINPVTLLMTFLLWVCNVEKWLAQGQ